MYILSLNLDEIILYLRIITILASYVDVIQIYFSPRHFYVYLNYILFLVCTIRFSKRSVANSMLLSILYSLYRKTNSEINYYNNYYLPYFYIYTVVRITTKTI